MQIFKNKVKLRGFLGIDAEVPPIDRITQDSYATLTVCIDSGFWDESRNTWVPRTVSHKIICAGAYFSAFCRNLKQGDYVEIKGELLSADAGTSVRVLEVQRIEYSLFDISGEG